MNDRVLRTCVVCRSSVEKDEALRIVLAPNGEACVDWRHKLPGRGASVCWKRSCLEGLRQKGPLNRSFKADVALPEGDWPLSAALKQLTRRQRELAGLATRAGELKAGNSLVDRTLKKGWPLYLGLSADAGKTVASDWQKRAKGYELALYRSLLTAEELGAALGRSGPRSVFAVGPGPLGKVLRSELKRGDALL
jgi:predicted RNA-binding protein YlxR (DUF448 family)